MRHERGGYAFSQVLLLITFLQSGFAQYQNIEAWGRACALGIEPDELRLKYFNDAASAFRNAVCGDWYNSHKQAVEGSGSVDVVKIVSVGGSGSSTSETVSHTQFCQDTSLTAQQTTIADLWIKTNPDDSLRSRFFDCMGQFTTQQVSPSPMFLIATDEGTAGILVSAAWNKNIAGTQPKFDHIDTSVISCSNVPIQKGTGLSSEPQSFTCKWPDRTSSDGLITLYTTNRGSIVSRVHRQIAPVGSYTLTIITKKDEPSGTEKICGPAGTTAQLDNNRLFCMFNPPPYPMGCDGGWSVAFLDFPLTNPKPSWPVIPGTLTLNCTRDNQGSCAWNEVDRPSRFQVIQNDGVNFTVRRSFGSQNIDVQLCASRQQFAPQERKESKGVQPLYDGATISIVIPDEATGSIHIEWPFDHSSEDFPAGSTSPRLKLTKTDNIAHVATYYRYQVSLAPDIHSLQLDKIRDFNKLQGIQ